MKMLHLQIRDSPTISFLKNHTRGLGKCTEACEHKHASAHTQAYPMPHVQGMFYTSRANTATQGEMYVYSRWGIEDEGLRTPSHMDTEFKERREEGQ